MNAIGGLVHHTSIAGTDTLGAFPNPAIWSMSAGNLLGILKIILIFV